MLPLGVEGSTETSRLLPVTLDVPTPGIVVVQRGAHAQTATKYMTPKGSPS
jgi:hypothetical protein